MPVARDKRVTLRSLYTPHTLRHPMSSSSPQPVPLAFEPDSIYLVFIMRAGRPCAGVFHHNSDNRGILAYADVGIPGPQRSHRKVFSSELKNSETPHPEPCLRATDFRHHQGSKQNSPSSLRTERRAFITTNGYQTGTLPPPSLSTRTNGWKASYAVSIRSGNRRSWFGRTAPIQNRQSSRNSRGCMSQACCS